MNTLRKHVKMVVDASDDAYTQMHKCAFNNQKSLASKIDTVMKLENEIETAKERPAQDYENADNSESQNHRILRTMWNDSEHQNAKLIQKTDNGTGKSSNTRFAYMNNKRGEYFTE